MRCKLFFSLLIAGITITNCAYAVIHKAVQSLKGDRERVVLYDWHIDKRGLLKSKKELKDLKQRKNALFIVEDSLRLGYNSSDSYMMKYFAHAQSYVDRSERESSSEEIIPNSLLLGITSKLTKEGHRVISVDKRYRAALFDRNFELANILLMFKDLIPKLEFYIQEYIEDMQAAKTTNSKLQVYYEKTVRSFQEFLKLFEKTKIFIRRLLEQYKQEPSTTIIYALRKIFPQLEALIFNNTLSWVDFLAAQALDKHDNESEIIIILGGLHSKVIVDTILPLLGYSVKTVFGRDYTDFALPDGIIDENALIDNSLDLEEIFNTIQKEEEENRAKDRLADQKMESENKAKQSELGLTIKNLMAEHKENIINIWFAPSLRKQLIDFFNDINREIEKPAENTLVKLEQLSTVFKRYSPLFSPTAFGFINRKAYKSWQDFVGGFTTLVIRPIMKEMSKELENTSKL